MPEKFICVCGWDETLYQELLLKANEKVRVAIISREDRQSASPFVKIHHLQTNFAIESLAKKVAWDAVLLPLEVIRCEEIAGFEDILRKGHLAAKLILSEGADLCVKMLNNARENRGSFRRGRGLKNAFSGIPAVIVGAGPSLEKNKHLLPEIKKKAILFSGGTALSKMGVAPHFAAGIDPTYPAENPYGEVPFCYQARVHPKSLSGEKILFGDSFSDAINWIYGEEFFFSGWTVGTFMTAVASYMGCSPLIFVGMDYCYADGKKYAGERKGEEELVEFRGNKTQADWIMALEWTESLAKQTPMINATEGGILDLPAQSLQEVLHEFTDLSFSIRQELDRAPLENFDRFEEWDEALRRQGSVVEENLLEPLWTIWRPVFARVSPDHMEIQQSVFYNRVLRKQLSPEGESF